MGTSDVHLEIGGEADFVIDRDELAVAIAEGCVDEFLSEQVSAMNREVIVYVDGRELGSFRE